MAKGGMSLFLGAMAQFAGKRHFAFDSFEGLPPPQVAKDNIYFRAGDYASRDGQLDLYTRFVQIVADFGLTGTIFPVRGWFKETVPATLPGRAVSFAHVDVDLFDSTYEVLANVFPCLVPGG